MIVSAGAYSGCVESAIPKSQEEKHLKSVSQGKIFDTLSILNIKILSTRSTFECGF
jgi:hypothetical protein